jgi:hypothetical protein
MRVCGPVTSNPSAVSWFWGGMTPFDLEQSQLDKQWRARFGQPVPVLGSPDLVRRILAETATWELAEAPSGADQLARDHRGEPPFAQDTAVPQA